MFNKLTSRLTKRQSSANNLIDRETVIGRFDRKFDDSLQMMIHSLSNHVLCGFIREIDDSFSICHDIKTICWFYFFGSKTFSQSAKNDDDNFFCKMKASDRKQFINATFSAICPHWSNSGTSSLRNILYNCFTKKIDSFYERKKDAIATKAKKAKQTAVIIKNKIIETVSQQTEETKKSKSRKRVVASALTYESWKEHNRDGICLWFISVLMDICEIYFLFQSITDADTQHCGNTVLVQWKHSLPASFHNEYHCEKNTFYNFYNVYKKYGKIQSIRACPLQGKDILIRFKSESAAHKCRVPELQWNYNELFITKLCEYLRPNFRLNIYCGNIFIHHALDFIDIIQLMNKLIKYNIEYYKMLKKIYSTLDEKEEIAADRVLDGIKSKKLYTIHYREILCVMLFGGDLPEWNTIYVSHDDIFDIFCYGDMDCSLISESIEFGRSRSCNVMMIKWLWLKQELERIMYDLCYISIHKESLRKLLSKLLIAVSNAEELFYSKQNSFKFEIVFHVLYLMIEQCGLQILPDIDVVFDNRLQCAINDSFRTIKYGIIGWRILEIELNKINIENTHCDPFLAYINEKSGLLEMNLQRNLRILKNKLDGDIDRAASTLGMGIKVCYRINKELGPFSANNRDMRLFTELYNKIKATKLVQPIIASFK